MGISFNCQSLWTVIRKGQVNESNLSVRRDNLNFDRLLKWKSKTALGRLARITRNNEWLIIYSVSVIQFTDKANWYNSVGQPRCVQSIICVGLASPNTAHHMTISHTLTSIGGGSYRKAGRHKFLGGRAENTRCPQSLKCGRPQNACPIVSATYVNIVYRSATNNATRRINIVVINGLLK